jgi:serine/threonine protein kinase/Tol biopolymer transport system component/tetratricopeptide (TPR) repeat protein
VDAERWEQVKHLFESALTLESSERETFISRYAGGDEELRREVLSLLESHDETGDFLEKPVLSVQEFAESAAAEPNLIGQRVGAWRLIEQIGRGGMGAVYLAARADNEFRKQVAIKLIRGGMETEFAIRRFRNERQILARLEHPNIARLIDGGATSSGMPYYVMEYVEGEPLTQYCESRRTPLRERVEIFLKTCAAVHYAHRRMIIHRDLKPSNILVKQDGTPKLLDFGIAKWLDPENDSAAETTIGGFRIVTPAYASPEQMRGEPATVRSDVYALGVILFELMAGRRPSSAPGGDPFELPAQGWDEATARLAGELRKVVMKAVRQDPAERYASVEALETDIRRCLEGESLPAPAQPGAGASAEPPSPGSVAVLPFRLLASDSSSDGYLGLGITDAVITRLSNIGRISVRPTSAVMNYHANMDALSAGRELNVEFIVEGRVQKSGELVRATVQLVHVETRKPVWAGSFQEQLNDLLKVEDSIAEQVAQALAPQLSGEEREQLARPGTTSAKAHQAYLRGRFHWSKLTDDSLAQALLCFMQAIAEDPQYARAHAGVADYYIQLGIRGGLPPAESFAAAKEAAARAAEIDPSLAEAHASLGFALWAHDGDTAAAQHHFHLAIALNPDYAPAHHWLGLLNSALGKPEMAAASLETARKLDPHSRMYAGDLAMAHYHARNYDAAIACARQAMHSMGRGSGSESILALALLEKGQIEDALAAAQNISELQNRPWFSFCILALTQGAAGDLRAARSLRERLEREGSRRYISGSAMALADLACGERERAIARLEQAVRDRDWWTAFLGVSPAWDPLRSDPGFRKLLACGQPERRAMVDARPAAPGARERWRRAPRWRMVAAALILGAVAGGALYWKRQLAPAPLQRASISRLTSNGTAERAALSPDGRYVAYTARSEGKLSVWVRDVKAREPYRIAGPIDAEIRTIGFTRGGARVAFAAFKYNDPTNGELYLLPVSGGGLSSAMSHIPGPVGLTDDEAMIAFLRANPASGSDDLVIRHTYGGEERVVASRKYPDRFAWSAVPSWSPDGKWIACAVAGSDRLGFRFALALVRVDDGSIRILESPRWQDVDRIAWLSDSAQLVVTGQEVNSSFHQIWHIPLGRGEPVRITNDLNDYASLGVTPDASALVSVQRQTIINMYAVRWNDPDNAVQITPGGGRYFDVASGPNGSIFYASDAIGPANIWSIRIDGSGQQQLTYDLGRCYSPAASPDGRTIAFHSNHGGSWNIWKMDRDGRNLVQLTKDSRDSNWPQFTPDGKFIVYHHTGDKVLSSIWKVAVDGGTPVEIIARESMHPTVAPDGKLAAWINETPGAQRWKIAVFPPDGAQPLKTFGFEGNVMPAPRLRWTPQSDAVTYVDRRNGVANVWLQPASGGPPRMLTNFTWGQIYSFDWARNGTLLLSRGISTTDVVLIGVRGQG